MSINDEEWTPPSAAELKVIQARRERSDRISKLMGDYLLKGYKMLSTSCEKCETILLRDREGVDYCVACSELDCDADKDDPALSEAAARKQAAEGEQRGGVKVKVVEASPLVNSSPGVAVRRTQLPEASGPRTSGLESQKLYSRNDIGSGSGLTPASSCASLRTGADCWSNAATANTALDLLDDEQAGVISGLSSLSQASTAQPPVEGWASCSETKRVLRDKIEWATGELVRSTSIESQVQLCNLIKSSAEAIGALNNIGSL